MQKTYFSQQKQTPIRGGTLKLALGNQKQLQPHHIFMQNSPEKIEKSWDTQNGVFLKIENSRQRSEERSDPAFTIPRGSSKQSPHLNQLEFKRATTLVETQFKEKLNINDDVLENLSKNAYSAYHIHQKASLRRKRSLSIKGYGKNNIFLPQGPSDYASAIQSQKILKKVQGERILLENLGSVKSSMQRNFLTSPQTDIVKSRQEETLPRSFFEQAHLDTAKTKNSALHENSGTIAGEEQPDQSNKHILNKKPLNPLEYSSEGALGNTLNQNENPKKTSSSDSQKKLSRSQEHRNLDGNTLQVSNTLPNERNSHPKDFKITSHSPKKQRTRPPTSPPKMSDRPSLELDQNQRQVLSRPQIAQSCEIPPKSSGNQILAESFIRPNSQIRRVRHPLSISPPKNREKVSHIINKEKIAEIKQQVLKLKFIKPRQPPKSKPRIHTSSADVGETSFLDNNLSHDIDLLYEEEEEFEESDLTARTLNGRLTLLESVYTGRPPTVFFPYPPSCEQTRDPSRTYVVGPEEEKAYDLKYKTPGALCLTRTFEAAGFKRTLGLNWNVLWGMPKYDRIREMNKYQKTNHFPGCWEIGRKDGLWRNLSKMKRQFPVEFCFIPVTYLLNTDYERFMQIKENSENKAIWIMKPVASACGRGIKLIHKKSKLTKKSNYLVSEYISNPHLINGLKYDLRVYVLVSSFDPLRIYIFKEGLVRFATSKYTTTKSHLKERFAHLTNWSVNKNSSNFVKNRDTKNDDEGSKWSFAALRKRFQELKIDYDDIFEKIRDIIIKTLISVEPMMLNSLNRTQEHKNNCFELYGFDILLDSNLKPWLMEVNVCPSLNSSSPLDRKIKTTLMCDIMNLVGFQPYEKKKYEDELKKKIAGLEIRKHVSKNCNDIIELNEYNCLEKLTAEDWNVLFDTDEENYRRGNFERIFPLKENFWQYTKYFEYQRYNNLIVWQWLKSRMNFLEKISSKVSEVSV